MASQYDIPYLKQQKYLISDRLWQQINAPKNGCNSPSSDVASEPRSLRHSWGERITRPKLIMEIQRPVPILGQNIAQCPTRRNHKSRTFSFLQPSRKNRYSRLDEPELLVTSVHWCTCVKIRTISFGFFTNMLEIQRVRLVRSNVPRDLRYEYLLLNTRRNSCIGNSCWIPNVGTVWRVIPEGGKSSPKRIKTLGFDGKTIGCSRRAASGASCLLNHFTWPTMQIFIGLSPRPSSKLIGERL